MHQESPPPSRRWRSGLPALPGCHDAAAPDRPRRPGHRGAGWPLRCRCPTGETRYLSHPLCRCGSPGSSIPSRRSDRCRRSRPQGPATCRRPVIETAAQLVYQGVGTAWSTPSLIVWRHLKPLMWRARVTFLQRFFDQTQLPRLTRPTGQL